MILLLISFVGGVLTVLAPCILPLLPVIVGGSLTGDKPDIKKSLVIVTSLGISVILFTFLLKASTFLIDIPQSFWQWFSGLVIIFLGITTIFPNLWEGDLLAKISAKANRLIGKGDQKHSFLGDVIVGGALGPVFTTCSPTYFIVLATVLPVSLFLGFIYLLAFAFGLSLALFLVALVGQKIMSKLDRLADPKGWFKRCLGVLFIFVGVMIISGFDKKLQVIILDAGYFDVTKIEQKLLRYTDDKDVKDISGESENNTAVDGDVIKSDILNQKSEYKIIKKTGPVAPELSTIDGYINTDGKEIKISDYRGKKVVLLDVWTYSCINCQRTIPYLNDWHSKYNDKGLVIIGLHTPEFAFEKVQENVEKAVKDFDIKYPVVLDNDYSTWNALGNRYWPRKYLINLDGQIVYDHIGEGAYKETEMAIREALGIDGDMGDQKISTIQEQKIYSKSPEVYFGAWRNTLLQNGNQSITGIQAFSAPNLEKNTLVKNRLYLAGNWDIKTESADTVDNKGEIFFRYEAKNVYMVANAKEGVEIDVYIDGVFHKTLNVKDEKLYQIVDGTIGREALLNIKVKGKDFQAFTFTFG